MKRLWICFLALCLTAFFCVSALVPGAEEANTEIWSIYSLKEDANGNPYFAAPPTYKYTDEGLVVTPGEVMNSYTVQTDHAYYLDNGIYMEVKLDEPAVAGVLVFHLWDQNGLLMANYNCGSGWQGMLQLDQNESQYMMSVYIQETTAEEKGYANILGSMKVNVPMEEDGSTVYTIHLKDGILRINGSIVVGMDEALGLLREARPDGSVYFGVSVVMGEKGGLVPITVSRFGTTPENAVVPGSGGVLPETGEASTETIPPAPVDTDPPEDNTAEPTPDTTPDGGDVSAPTDTKPSDDPDVTDPVGDGTEEPEEQTTDDFKSPFEETESETKKEIQNEAVDNFMDKLENVKLGCGSVVSAGCLGIAPLLAAAYVCLRKKN